ncbi:MAG: magnesium transporter [Planctomycetota bacterium]
MSENPIIQRLLDRYRYEDYVTIKEMCAISQPVDVAEALSHFEPSDALKVLKMLPLDVQVDIFPYLDPEMQEQLALLMPLSELSRLFSELPSDDRADLFKSLPEGRQEELYRSLASAEREDLRRLESYPEGSCGAAMTSDYMSLPPDITASRAINLIRAQAPDKETIYYCYVVSPTRKLIGIVSLRDLILAHPERLVGDIMKTEVLHCNVYDDQEKAANIIRKYDLIALPITNGNNSLVGIITHDDALDIFDQEHTEDLEKFMAIAGSHEAGAYMRTPIWQHFRNRVGWILGLAFLGTVSGYIVQSFEGLLLQFAVLASFMPMLADTGGNTGSQSATLVIRAMALGEVSPKDLLRVLWRELLVAIPLAVLLGMFAIGRVFVFYSGDGLPPSVTPSLVGFTIALALGLQVVTSTLVGALLPMAAARLRLDPAVVASPALTTVVDISGLIIFFTTAKVLLTV